MDRLKQFTAVLTDIGVNGLCDIAVVTLVIYAFLVALKRTRRSGLIFTGILILGIIYLVARKYNLLLTVTILQGFFAIFLVALVIIFQEDLRYFFERVGRWWMDRRLPLSKRRAPRLPRHEVEILARTLSDLARLKIGALIVIRGRDQLARHLTGGQDVQAILSEPLLKSIFDPHSLGHDGAVIVEGDRIDLLGAHLPLSINLEKLPRSGTRHAAALGLSERTDALCLVVSEEHGAISAARRGEIWMVPDASSLGNLIEAFYSEMAPPPDSRPWPTFFKRNNREKAVALVLSVALWMLVVHRSQVVGRSFEIPVTYGLLQSNLVVSNIAPASVRVTLTGQRRDFDFLNQNTIRVSLQLWDVTKGRRHLTVPITSRDLSYPESLNLEDIEPRQVTLDITERPPAETPGQH
jgi:diadenylate cyclase